LTRYFYVDQADHLVLSEKEKMRKVLDVGCGSGMYVEQYRAQGIDAYGVDLCITAEKPHLRRLDIFSPEMTEFCHQLGPVDYVISLGEFFG
jgi:SAM-dependent methyltransferase